MSGLSFLGTTIRSPRNSSPSASCSSSLTFQYCCSTCGSDPIFLGHPLLLMNFNCCSVSSVLVASFNSPVLSVLTGKLLPRLCTITSTSSAAPHDDSPFINALDRVSATYLYLPGMHFTSRVYLCNCNIIRCNRGEAFAIGFFKIDSSGL